MAVIGRTPRYSEGFGHTMLTIRVALVDDHGIVRKALRAYFEEHADISVVGEAASGIQAVELANTVPLDVMVMDLAMPHTSGVDALPVIRARRADLPVLILSSYPEEHYAVKLIQKGANGFLNKQCDPQEIVTAVRRLASGHRYISATVAQLLAQHASRPGLSPVHEHLSPREQVVFLSLAQGDSVSTIAARLNLNSKTVSTYRMRLLEKLMLSSNSDLTYYAVKNQLIN